MVKYEYKLQKADQFKYGARSGNINLSVSEQQYRCWHPQDLVR